MHAGFFLLSANLLLKWVLHLHFVVDGSLSQCSKQEQVQNDDSAAIILLVEALTQAAKIQCSHVHFADRL